MAGKTSPQFFTNDLRPITIDESTLRAVLSELRIAIRHGIELIRSKDNAPNAAKEEESWTIFSGTLGIALMFLRLEEQAHALSDFNQLKEDFEPPLPDFRALARENITKQAAQAIKFKIDRPSPLCSPALGSSVIRILATTNESDDNGLSPKNVERDIETLHEACEIAVTQAPAVVRNGHSMGGDEALYGRAGLLWALGNIDRHNLNNRTTRALRPMLGIESKLWGTIMDAGRKGSQEYARVHGDTEALPLMWPWIDDYCGLGAMHGITGILTILLGYECSKSDYEVIGNTITDLCGICVSHKGHLPMSVPPWKTSRPSPLVQICHGTPGLLLLLATAKGIPAFEKFQPAEWDEAIRLGSERIWEEGLLSKGGGLCHGIAGNAWPWLALHEKAVDEEYVESKQTKFEKGTVSQCEKLSADDFLSKALAFLLAARDTPPFATESRYRMPDTPFSLFEGLAGTICAWSEACAVIKARLERMEDDSGDPRHKFHGCRTLGFPGLGGMVCGPRYDPHIGDVVSYGTSIGGKGL